ncbi:RDD family protein [Desulfosarcina sp. OttesenSCG-928-G10]|nr:RDD family protein [Desulfosarcina sp. OttesenSCG-928-G10]
MRYAGFWWRFAAAFIDSWVLFFPGEFLDLFIEVAMGVSVEDDLMAFAWSFGLSFVLSGFYFALMESSSIQGTVGKWLVGLKVTDLNGNRIGFGRAIRRYLFEILSFLTLFAGYFMIFFTPKKQALHDVLTDTVVVQKGQKIAIEKCPNCGRKNLSLTDYKKKGVKLLVAGGIWLLVSLWLAVLGGIVVQFFWLFVFWGYGINLLSKKRKYLYACRHCTWKSECDDSSCFGCFHFGSED